MAEQSSSSSLAYFEDKSFNRLYKAVIMNIVLMLYIQNNIHGFDKWSINNFYYTAACK